MELDLIRTVAPAGGQRSKPLLIGVSRNRLKSLLSINHLNFTTALIIDQ